MPTKNNKCDIEEGLRGREEQNLKSGSSGLSADISSYLEVEGEAVHPFVTLCGVAFGRRGKKLKRT